MSGRGSVWLERTVRDREVGGSNPLAPTTTLNIEMKAFLYRVIGIVQGVGFRYFVYRKAIPLGLSGYVKNLIDGSVEVFVQGEEPEIQILEEALRKGPSFSHVTDIVKTEVPIKPQYKEFRIEV